MADAIKKWPFVESPGEFADRLAEAMRYFGHALPAVRNVLIENPPKLSAEYLAALAAQQPAQGDLGGLKESDFTTVLEAQAWRSGFKAGKAQQPAQGESADMPRSVGHALEMALIVGQYLRERAPEVMKREALDVLAEVDARRTASPAQGEAVCSGCNGRGEVGGWAGDSYQTDPCPFCAAPPANWSLGDVFGPGDNTGQDYWSAGITIGAHPDAIECYGDTQEEAESRRALVMASVAGKP